jgi:hypothetical protein
MPSLPGPLASQPLVTKPLPDIPFHQIAVNFAGKQFLIIMDNKTDWPDIIAMGKDTTTPKPIEALRAHNMLHSSTGHHVV